MENKLASLISNPNQVYDYQEANLALMACAFDKKLPTLSEYQDFCKAFCFLVTKSNEIDFDSIGMMIAKRSFSTNHQQRDVFDEVSNQNIYLDKKALNIFISTLGKSAPYNQNLSSAFKKKIENFVKKTLHTHSFNKQELSDLQQTLSLHYPNNQIRNQFAHIGVVAEKICRYKKNRDVIELNNWAFREKREGLLQKLSFRSTYINLLYESVVQQNDIKNINPEKHYKNHLALTSSKIKDIIGTVDKKGKEICPKYAMNKVYKAVASQDSFKLDAIEHNLSNHTDYDFYTDSKNILQSIHGGDKNREIKLPKKVYSCTH